MTIEPAAIPNADPIISLKDQRDISVLEDIFTLGFTKSDPITVFEDKENNFEVNVVFRTVTPSELMAVYEAAGCHGSLFAQRISERLETLARAIQFINRMPLLLSASDQAEYLKRVGLPEDKAVTPLDQAKIILTEKIKSPAVIDALWEAYETFRNTVTETVTNLKKK